MKGRSRIASTACLALLLCHAAIAAPATPPPADADWAEIGRLAAAVQQADGTDAALPFERPSAAALAAAPRQVFALYFPFFLTSMDNAPPARDHWAQHYMKRAGEGGKYASAGGFTRERPLPAGPWPGPYWRETAEAVDVLRARAIGLDAFGVGLQEPGSGHTFNISLGVCQAAAHLVPGFHVFGEPDAAVLRDIPAETMVRTIATYETCPAALRTAEGHGLVAPFAPNNEPVSYWADVLARLKADGARLDFIPVLLDPGRFAEGFGPLSQAMSFWGQRDTFSMANPGWRAALARIKATAPDWMQPVTPQDFRPNAQIFWEARNTEMFRASWMEAIQGHARYAHVITWNDYSEGTELAPSSGTQFLFYDLAAYYIAWFKTGTPPRITRDAIYYSHRTQIFSPDAPPQPGDLPFRRLGETPLANDIEMLAMLTAPAEIEIEIAGRRVAQAAPAGLTALRAPAAAGRPHFRILRAGAPVVEKTSDWEIAATPEAASGMYFGGSSTRRFVPLPAE